MMPGKLCLLRQGPNGPYFNHQSWEHGKNCSCYVTQEKLPDFQKAIQGYQQFQQLTQQYAQLIIDKTRGELEAGSKKKNRRPNSSSPRTRKSSN